MVWYDANNANTYFKVARFLTFSDFASYFYQYFDFYAFEWQDEKRAYIGFEFEFDYYNISGSSDWSRCVACFDLSNGESLQAKDTGVGFCEPGNAQDELTLDLAYDGGCSTYCNYGNSIGKDYNGVIFANSSTSFSFVNSEKNDWDLWYNWNTDGDYTYETSGEVVFEYDNTTGSFALYRMYMDLYSKDLHNGASKDDLGLRVKSNVTMQCFWGGVTSDPGEFGSFDLSGWETHDPTQVDLKYMSAGAWL